MDQSPSDVAIQPPLDSEALNGKPPAKGVRAPRVPSIVGWFSPLPSLGYAADSVEPPACPLVLAAARALPSAIGEDAQNDSSLVTTPDERATVGTAAPSPRCGGPAQLFHDGSSD